MIHLQLKRDVFRRATVVKVVRLPFCRRISNEIHYDGRWHDYHSEPVQDDLCELVQDVMQYAPVRSIILERDGNFPVAEELVEELAKLEACCLEAP